MRITPSTLRTSLVVVTATAAMSLGVASGAFAATADPAAPVTAAAPAHAQRVYVKTVDLAVPGHTAKLFRTGPHAYQADVFFHDRKIATVAAKDNSATATNLDGLNVQLTSQGQVSSWIERAQPQPKPQPKPQPQPVSKRVLVNTERLADGSTARIYRLGSGHYQADIYGTTKLGTLDADGRPAAAENNGLHIVLNPDGTLDSWMDQVPAPLAGTSGAAAPDAAALNQAA